jgi:hypothetical protein
MAVMLTYFPREVLSAPKKWPGLRAELIKVSALISPTRKAEIITKLSTISIFSGTQKNRWLVEIGFDPCSRRTHVEN